MLTSLGYLLILACSVLLNGDQFGPIVNRFEEKYSELLDENVNYPDEQYPDVPLQIVRPDSLHKKLVVVEKNLKVSLSLSLLLNYFELFLIILFV